MIPSNKEILSNIARNIKDIFNAKIAPSVSKQLLAIYTRGKHSITIVNNTEIDDNAMGDLIYNELTFAGFTVEDVKIFPKTDKAPNSLSTICINILI